MFNLLIDSIFRDLGAHIDGFIAVAAHTVVIGASAGNPVTGRKADVILAAYYASQAALRRLKPVTSVSSLIYKSIFLLLILFVNRITL